MSGLTDQFLARITKLVFDFGVDHHNSAGGIDHHHAVRTGFDRQPEHLVGETSCRDGQLGIIALQGSSLQQLMSALERLRDFVGLLDAGGRNVRQLATTQRESRRDQILHRPSDPRRLIQRHDQPEDQDTEHAEGAVQQHRVRLAVQLRHRDADRDRPV
jgi:hypothetical protein